MALKNFLIQFYFFSSYLVGFGQTLPLTEVGHLPDVVQECSGMVRWDAERLIILNDGGNKPALYLTDTTGQLLQTLCFSTLDNQDWEAMALDAFRQILYVGDFGNNRNRRQNLQIYKIQLRPSGDSITAQVLGRIRYRYPDQKEFPPPKGQRVYDLESMIHFRDSLYLFTKNRSSPFTGYTYQYALPTDTGRFVALRQDSFKTGAGLMPSYWVVDASLDLASGHFALLGYDKLWLFEKVRPPHFLQGEVTEYKFNHLSQKEALTLHDGRLWIGNENESRGKTENVLFKGQLPPEKMTLENRLATLLQREVGDTLPLALFAERPTTVRYEIFNMEGQRLLFGSIKPEQYQPFLDLPIADLPFGGYLLNVIIHDEPHALPFSKPYRP